MGFERMIGAFIFIGIVIVAVLISRGVMKKVKRK